MPHPSGDFQFAYTLGSITDSARSGAALKALDVAIPGFHSTPNVDAVSARDSSCPEITAQGALDANLRIWKQSN